MRIRSGSCTIGVLAAVSLAVGAAVGTGVAYGQADAPGSSPTAAEAPTNVKDFTRAAVAHGVPPAVAEEAAHDPQLAKFMPVRSVTTRTETEVVPMSAADGSCDTAAGFRLHSGRVSRTVYSHLNIELYTVWLDKRWCANARR